MVTSKLGPKGSWARTAMPNTSSMAAQVRYRTGATSLPTAPVRLPARWAAQGDTLHHPPARRDQLPESSLKIAAIVFSIVSVIILVTVYFNRRKERMRSIPETPPPSHPAPPVPTQRQRDKMRMPPEQYPLQMELMPPRESRASS